LSGQESQAWREADPHIPPGCPSCGRVAKYIVLYDDETGEYGGEQAGEQAGQRGADHDGIAPVR